MPVVVVKDEPDAETSAVKAEVVIALLDPVPFVAPVTVDLANVSNSVVLFAQTLETLT